MRYASYVAKFVRPKTAGTYKIVVRFKCDATKKPSKRAKRFALRRS